MVKLVDSDHYHLWSDALHARALTHQARNRLDRGTYVRWTVTTAWAVLEEACEEALSATGIGRRFKENLEAAVAARGLTPLDWGSGIWQRVLQLHKARKSYVHPTGSADLFSEVAEGEFAISTVRDAVKDIYARAGKLPLKWIDDDDDRRWDGGIKDMADATVIRAGVDEESGDTLRLTYIYEGKEYESDVRPYDAGHEVLLDKLVVAVNVPIAEFRAYRGSALLTVRKLHVRGA